MAKGNGRERTLRHSAAAEQGGRRAVMADFRRTIEVLREQRATMSIAQIWTLLFDKNVAKSAIKHYLSEDAPERAPRQRIIDEFERAARRAKAYNNPWWKLEGLLVELLSRSHETQQDFKRYHGDYTFWRLDAHNQLVKGWMRLGRHETAGVPFHWHEHTQHFDPEKKVPITFKYQGPVIVMAHNVCLLSIDSGSLRLTMLRGVNDPKEEHITGMLMTEDFDFKYPFAVKLLLAHESYLAKTQIKEDFIRTRLANAPSHKDLLRF